MIIFSCLYFSIMNDIVRDNTREINKISEISSKIIIIFYFSYLILHIN